MSERSVRKGDRFRWWNSDRSGFQFGFQPLTSAPNDYSRESGRPVHDKGIQVAPDEFDQPPPSTKPLGGEGEIGSGARDDSSPATPSNVYVVTPEAITPVQYLVAGSQINWNADNVPIFISGSLTTVILSSDPQVVAGTTNQQITLMCVGSTVTVISGNGIALRTSSYAMSSGSLLNLFYGTGWTETSRGNLYGDLGSL